MSPNPREATESEKSYQDYSHLPSLIKEEQDYLQRRSQQKDSTPSAPGKKPVKVAGASTRSDKYKAQLLKLDRTLDPVPTKTLSVVVPAYNESERLPIMMKETLDFLKAKAKKEPGFTYEILIIDDGSQDSTVRVALELAQQEKDKDIRVVSFEINRGKGGAVIQVGEMGVFLPTLIDLRANNRTDMMFAFLSLFFCKHRVCNTRAENTF